MKNEYPKMMYVDDEPIINTDISEKLEVLDCVNVNEQDLYITRDYTDNGNNYCAWKYAVDLDYFEKQVKEITIEEIAQRFGYPIEQIRIKK